MLSPAGINTYEMVSPLFRLGNRQLPPIITQTRRWIDMSQDMVTGTIMLESNLLLYAVELYAVCRFSVAAASPTVSMFWEIYPVYSFADRHRGMNFDEMQHRIEISCANQQSVESRSLIDARESWNRLETIKRWTRTQ